MVIVACKKNDEPAPVDIFTGEYLLQEVIEEYDPADPDKVDEKFLAPENYLVSKSDFLNPVTGELTSTYKFLIGDTFVGLNEQSGSGSQVLAGTRECAANELKGVSITLQESGSYRLNMVNCVGREILADYIRSVPE